MQPYDVRCITISVSPIDSIFARLTRSEDLVEFPIGNVRYIDLDCPCFEARRVMLEHPGNALVRPNVSTKPINSMTLLKSLTEEKKCSQSD